MKNGKFLSQVIHSRTGYIVDKLIAQNRLAMWASTPGKGKSLTSEVIGYSIPYEAPFLGMKVTGGNIMFIDSENRHDVLVNRCKKIKKGLERDGYKMKGEVDFQHYSGFLLDDKTTWQKIENEINAVEPVLIIIDHLACFHHQNEDRQKPMSGITTALEELMAIKGSSLLVLHHFNKKYTGSFFDRLRGSSAIYAKTDAACEVRSISIKDGRLEKIGLIPQQRKDITPAPIRIKVEEGNDWLKLIADGTYRPIEDPEMDRVSHNIYHLFLDKKKANVNELSVNDVRGEVEGYASDNEIRKVLRELESMGLLEHKATASNKFFYSLKTSKCPWCQP